MDIVVLIGTLVVLTFILVAKAALKKARVDGALSARSSRITTAQSEALQSAAYAAGFNQSMSLMHEGFGFHITAQADGRLSVTLSDDDGVPMGTVTPDGVSFLGSLRGAKYASHQGPSPDGKQQTAREEPPEWAL